VAAGLTVAETVSLALAAGSALLGGVLWSRLPATVVVRFSAGGTPETAVSKAVAVAFVPLLVFVTTAGLALLAERAPDADRESVGVLGLATAVFVTGVHGAVLARNVGVAVSLNAVVGGGVLVVAAATGVVLLGDREQPTD
jgi:hypothetical protein